MEIRVLIVDMAYPINTRCQRIEESLKKKYGEANVVIVGWNREHDELKSPSNAYVFNVRAYPGDKKKKLLNLRGYSKFIGYVISQFKPNIIIASLWQALVLCSKYVKNGTFLIYDNVDVPTGSPILVKISRYLEKKALKKTYAIVHASRFFKNLYPDYGGHQVIVENTPTQILEKNCLSDNEDEDTPLRIVFNGALRYPETMINLIEAVGDIPGIRVDFYGRGVGQQGEEIIRAGEKYQNIFFHGAYKYSETSIILSNADVIWAVYPSRSRNVKYAISNKFHESLAYVIPGIFAADTYLGRLVKEEAIGFVVKDQSIEDIRKTILEIQKSKNSILNSLIRNIETYRKTQPLTWDQSYKPLDELINFIAEGDIAY